MEWSSAYFPEKYRPQGGSGSKRNKLKVFVRKAKEKEKNKIQKSSTITYTSTGGRLPASNDDGRYGAELHVDSNSLLDNNIRSGTMPEGPEPTDPAGGVRPAKTCWCLAAADVPTGCPR